MIKNRCSIKQLDSARYGDWNAYVNSHSHGTVFHLTQWKEVVERAFGHKAFYYFAERDEKVVGVLPLVQLKSFLFGNILSSLPFAAYGGPLVDDQNVLDDLLEVAKNLTSKLNGDYLDLKFFQKSDTGLPGSDLHVTFIKGLLRDHDANLKAIPRKQRAMVRKGLKSGLTAHFSKDLFNEFYDVYATNVQRLGTPVYSQKWFKTILDVFEGDAELLVVRYDGKAISGVLTLYYKDVVLPYYAGSLAEYRHLAPNDFQYWMLMKHAVERGCRFFDFGRSKKDSGHYKFKKHWGFEPQQLHYQYYLHNLKEKPELNPLNPKYRFKIEAWKRIPASVAKFIGPHIVKNIP